MGLNDVLYHEKNSFVIGRLAGNPDKTAVGFIAHVDTADFAAENINPRSMKIMMAKTFASMSRWGS